MAAYQKSVHELYMPKASEKKKSEREYLQKRLKTEPRAPKPYVDYLSDVAKMNKQSKAGGQSVGVLPNLENKGP